MSHHSATELMAKPPTKEEDCLNHTVVEWSILEYLVYKSIGTIENPDRRRFWCWEKLSSLVPHSKI